MLALLAVVGWAGGLPRPVTDAARVRSVAAASGRVAWLDDRGVWLADRQGRTLKHARLDATALGTVNDRLIACNADVGWDLESGAAASCAGIVASTEGSGRIDADHCPDRVWADETGIWWEPADCGRPTRTFTAVIEDGTRVDARVGETLGLSLVGLDGPGTGFHAVDLPDGVGVAADGRVEIRVDEPRTLRIGLYWRDVASRPHYDLLTVRVRGEPLGTRAPDWARFDHPARCVRSGGISVGRPDPWGTSRYWGSPAVAYTCETKGQGRAFIGVDTAPLYWFTVGEHLLGAHILGFVAGVGVGGESWTFGPYATAGMMFPANVGVRALWMPLRAAGQHWGLELRYGALFDQPSTSETFLYVSWRPDP
jgi:hypothetical protein